MSAIERLRELLEERGVKWWESKGYGTSIIYTFWSSPKFGRVYAIENDDGTLFMASLNNCDFTPEQAIEATLGNEGSYTRDDVESAFVSGYSLGCLPVGSDPQWDQNEQTVDEHMAELGWVRAATLGAGACEVEGYDDGVDEGMDGDWYSYAPPTWYLSCGHRCEGSERPSFCPMCGARVVE